MSGGSGGSSAGATGVSLTAKGDLLTFNTAETRLPVSVTNGQVLTTNSAVADGIEWATAASGGAKSFFVNNQDHNLQTTLTYIPLSSVVNNTAESEMNSYIPLAFTWSNLSFQCRFFNATGGNPTVKSRDDGSTGNQTITITGTGGFEDVSNTDTVAANSLVNYIYGGEPTGGSAVPASVVSVCEI